MAKQVDVLITNGMVLTVDSKGDFFENGALAITGDRIVGVGTVGDLDDIQAKETVDAQGKLIIPGLVNCHTHMPMSLFRGLADDLPLEQWLHEIIFPAEAQFITPQSVRLGARLSAAEMLLNGITTCCDGYFLAHDIAQAVAETGLRAILGQGVIDYPAPGVPDPNDKIVVAERFVQSWLGRSPLVSPSIFCHAPYTCAAETLQAAKQVANNLGVLFQIHVAETKLETQQCRDTHGCTPVAYLEQLGLLDRRTILIHAVWVDPSDIDIIAKHQSHMAHCPESNMKLASGIAPVPDMLSRGIIIGLGTDGCASNNDLDLLAEMDMAAKLHKVFKMDPTVMNADTLVRMATIQGARSLGLEESIGSLEVGKQADLVMIDTAKPHLTPMYRPESHLVYTVKGADVQDVMIAGQWVVKGRKLTTLDLASVIQEAKVMGNAIAGSKANSG